ncbi:putative phospholipid-binding lipoprotein MlaA [Nitrosomonas stercoris]|uniref:Putative phospholipid-binding lipoprotein MlaA n=1 Tax=Nitrosomonas stercoris TaxID=1444684 RepID=A0A4Y1YN84_9PROT|nr:putative phospholipid-binding lipoprotein MlaA [Nitrosomonas stercoris]
MIICFRCFRKLLVILVLGSALIGCASVNNRYDPLEPMNRAVFSFNEKLDEVVAEPVARGYQQFVPFPLRMIVGNFFSNLDDVVVAANALLQLKFMDALASTTRVVINTTFGMLGAIDLASDITQVSDIDISKRNEDFGQTLGFYGVASGPYLVLPVLGPSSVRDAIGIGVDSTLIHPARAIYTGFDLLTVRFPVATAEFIDKREQLLGLDKTLEEASLDKYEFVRDAYLQRRGSLIQNNGASLEEESLDFDEEEIMLDDE